MRFSVEVVAMPWLTKDRLTRKISIVAGILLFILLLLSIMLFLVLPWMVPKVGVEIERQVVGVPPTTSHQASVRPFPLGEENLVLEDDLFPYPLREGQIGPIENNYAMPLQYPFYCGGNLYPNRQPLVDNHDKVGVPVYRLDKDNIKTREIIGYSRDCLHPTRVDYFYNRIGTRDFFPLEQADNDIAKVTANGSNVDFIVRLETGTINRFIYGIVAIDEGLDRVVSRGEKPNGKYWNKKLVYSFRGGVGIGRKQGSFRLGDILKRQFDQLEQGYGVAYSTGNQTSNHYNMRLAEDTARRVKRQFVSLYGEPIYTVGIGGSGGAVQQYLIAQNSSDILDAIIPLYSYPDMVTQIIYVFDCELLEYYMDITDNDNDLWRLASNKQKVVGLNSNNKLEHTNTYLSRIAALINGKFKNQYKGSTECIAGWRGLTPLINNPRFYHHSGRYSKSVRRSSHWTHWEDLKHFYGTDDDGYANTAWDNVGVQYGLSALTSGFISPQQFIHLNRHVGGWVTSKQHKNENYWAINGRKSISRFSPWSHQNMTHDNWSEVEGKPAQRSRANPEAIEAITNSGQVFRGSISIPVLDIRHYLEEELDMHHSSASFSTRARIMAAGGDVNNQVVWVSHKKHNPVNAGFQVIDQWMMNIRRNPKGSLSGNRPLDAVDSCFDKRGNILASGEGVWDGEWNKRLDGKCMSRFPIYKTSRMAAGEGIAGDLFKCQTMTVQRAIEEKLYGDIDMASWVGKLEEVFPDGVCNYMH